MSPVRSSLAALAGLALAGCAHGGDARFPKRPVGCEVKLFHGSPDVPTVNIGPVRARCDQDIPENDCIRTLLDTVCDLGGDVVWGVDDPVKADGKVRYSGRAAHTRVAKPASPPATP